MAYMYILECCDGSYYTGSTRDLERRLWEHLNFQGANYTKKKHPVKLVYCEEFDRIDEAFYREKQVQGWRRVKKKALIENRKEDLPMLAKNYTQYRKTGASASSSTVSSASSDSGASASSDTGEWQVVEPAETTGSEKGCLRQAQPPQIWRSSAPGGEVS